MEKVFLVKVNKKFESEINYLKEIETEFRANNYDFNVEVADVNNVEYYINDELYSKDTFLDEDGIVSFITHTDNSECNACST